MSLKKFHLNQTLNNYFQQITTLTNKTNQRMIELRTKFNHELNQIQTEYRQLQTKYLMQLTNGMNFWSTIN